MLVPLVYLTGYGVAALVKSAIWSILPYSRWTKQLASIHELLPRRGLLGNSAANRASQSSGEHK